MNDKWADKNGLLHTLMPSLSRYSIRLRDPSDLGTLFVLPLDRGDHLCDELFDRGDLSVWWIKEFRFQPAVEAVEDGQKVNLLSRYDEHHQASRFQPS